MRWTGASCNTQHVQTYKVQQPPAAKHSRCEKSAATAGYKEQAITNRAGPALLLQKRSVAACIVAADMWALTGVLPAEQQHSPAASAGHCKGSRSAPSANSRSGSNAAGVNNSCRVHSVPTMRVWGKISRAAGSQIAAVKRVNVWAARPGSRNGRIRAVPVDRSGSTVSAAQAHHPA